MDPHSRASKKNTSHGKKVLPQDTTHLKQRPCYQRRSLCQDPAGNWTTRRPPDHRKETLTEVVWPYLPFVRSGQNHLARHSERGKKRGVPTDYDLNTQMCMCNLAVADLIQSLFTCVYARLFIELCSIFFFPPRIIHSTNRKRHDVRTEQTGT